MKVKFYLAMAIAALMMTNCSQEESVIQSNGSINVLRATIEGVTSRSSVTDGGVFSWNENDAIAVGNADNKFTKYNYEADNKFSPTVDITPTGYAIYPYNEDYTSFVEGTLPSIILKEEYTYGSTNAPMLATIEKGATSLFFKHLAGLMRFRVKNIPASASTFTLTAEGKNITGTFAPSTDDEENAYINAGEYGTENQVKITFTEVKDVMEFYVPMPVGTYGKLTVTIGEKQLESREGATNIITRGKLLLMPTMTFNDEGNLVLEGGNNVSLEANEEVNLDVNLNAEVNENGSNKKLDFMSTGYKDLIYICMRLSLIESLFEG